MDTHYHRNISNFFIAGINYKKSDASVRGQFAVNSEQYGAILTEAAQLGIYELFVLSTCNRTEIYGFAPCVSSLIELLCRQTNGDPETFKSLCYIKSGACAVEHLFKVGAGLDSQILGDYEIVGQIKGAARFAKEQGCVGAFLERLLNSVLQASKLIKNTTDLSGGTVSVSFAAVQYLRNHVPDICSKNILLLGVGKIGRNTCKNLVDYLGTRNITLINRTEERAAGLACSLCLRHAAIEDLAAEIHRADIILVATNAPEPTIREEHLQDCGPKLIIDLSIPYNVSEAARNLPHVQMVNVDELSRLKDETLRKRQGEVPKAQLIIAEGMAEFTDWHEMRRHVPLLKAAKLKMKQMHTDPLFPSTSACCNKEADARIQRVINDMASKIRAKNNGGACHYIEAINTFMTRSTTTS